MLGGNHDAAQTAGPCGALSHWTGLTGSCRRDFWGQVRKLATRTLFGLPPEGSQLAFHEITQASHREFHVSSCWHPAWTHGAWTSETPWRWVISPVGLWTAQHSGWPPACNLLGPCSGSTPSGDTHRFPSAEPAGGAYACCIQPPAACHIEVITRTVSTSRHGRPAGCGCLWVNSTLFPWEVRWTSGLMEATTVPSYARLLCPSQILQQGTGEF